MALNIDDGRKVTRTALAARCFLRDRWDEDWVEVPYLYADRVVAAAAPQIGSAELRYDYGWLMRPDKTEFAVYEPIERSQAFVKIEIDDPLATIVWCGVLINSSHAESGSPLGADGVTRVRQGRQLLTAASLEWILDRERIRTSAVRDVAAGTDIGWKYVGRGLTFNGGGHHWSEASAAGVRRPNRSLNDLNGLPIFAETMGDAAVKWTGLAILDYLLNFHEPASADRIDTFSWSVLGQAASLAAFEPVIAIEGKTLKELIDQVIDRRRLFGWDLQVDENNGLVINVWTFNAEEIPLDHVEGAPDVLPPNQNQVALDHRTRLDVDGLSIDLVDATKYDRVVVRGARRGCCFTIACMTEPELGTIVQGWSSSEEDEYDTAATEESGYGALDDFGKMDRNQAVRKHDLLRRVYSYFELVGTWDGTGQDMRGLPGAAPDVDVIPEINPLGPEVFSRKFWRPGLRFEPLLPLVADHDYSGPLTEDDSVPDELPLDGTSEWMKPLVGILRSDDSVPRWHQVDKLGHAGEDLPSDDVGEEPFGMSVRMQSDNVGFVLEVSGRPQHAIAKGTFEAADAVDEKDWPAVIDWRKGLFATVFLYADEHVEQRYPDAIAGTRDRYETLVIDIGEKGRLDYLAPGTVVAIKAGNLATTDGGFVRDDRPMMKTLATIAYQWYTAERRAVTLKLRQITGAFRLGQLLTGLGDPDEEDSFIATGSCVTQIAWDLLEQTTTISTQFAELDVKAFF